MKVCIIDNIQAGIEARTEAAPVVSSYYSNEKIEQTATVYPAGKKRRQDT